MIADDSGEFRMVGEVLTYCSDAFGSWELPITDIAVIGEYTNEDGPLADDYFLVFLQGGEPGWLEGSFFADGRDAVLMELSRKLGADISCGLAHQATFTSRILWPDHLMGRELFEFRPERGLKNRQSIRGDVDRQARGDGPVDRPG
ncbi:MAG: hypothetical protein ACR2RV_15855 [Verrucomicrobiales bacterium]